MLNTINENSNFTIKCHVNLDNEKKINFILRYL